MNVMLSQLLITHNLFFISTYRKNVYQSEKWNHILHKAEQEDEWPRLLLLDSYFALQERINHRPGFVSKDPLIPPSKHYCQDNWR